jgi:ferric-dicitrate binding protein FerR (iron transport regulator)
LVDSLRVNRPNDQIAETAWTENRLAFNAESLSEVISKIEKWYGVKVRLDNPAINNLHFTGSYQSEDLKQVMDALHMANPGVRYKLENNDQLLILF